jgi:hypothetical protein
MECFAAGTGGLESYLQAVSLRKQIETTTASRKQPRK